MTDAQPTPNSFCRSVRLSQGTARAQLALDLIQHKHDIITMSGLLEWGQMLMLSHVSGDLLLSDSDLDYIVLRSDEDTTE